MYSHLPHATLSRISSATLSTLFLKEIAATELGSLSSSLAGVLLETGGWGASELKRGSFCALKKKKSLLRIRKLWMLKWACTCEEINNFHLQGSEQRWLGVSLILHWSLREPLNPLIQNYPLLREGTRVSEIPNGSPQTRALPTRQSCCLQTNQKQALSC